MAEWAKKYFSDDITEKVILLLQKNGKDDPVLHQSLFEKAALCRLSFASLKVDIQEARTFYVCPASIISQTAYGMKKSRPMTAKWAFWLGHMLRRELEVEGKQPTSDFLSKLIALFLNRNVTAEEARTKFSQLRKVARSHATSAAPTLFKNHLYPDLCDKGYESKISIYVENIYAGPFATDLIMMGMTPDYLVKDIVKTRRSLLLKIGLSHHFEEEEPIIQLEQASKIIHGVPIPIGGGFAFNSPIPKGTIHLEKANDIPFPEPYLQQTAKSIGRSSVNIEKDDQGGSTLSMSFPIEAVTSGEPCAAALVAVPAWWPGWKAFMHVLDARARKPKITAVFSRVT